MSAKVTILSTLVAIALALPQYTYDAPADPFNPYAPSRTTSTSAPSTPATPTTSAAPGDSSSENTVQYDNQYIVTDEESGNNFGHQETRDGALIEGTYFVELADGRMQIVNYYVTPEDGFVAEVTYEGEATEAPETVEATEDTD